MRRLLLVAATGGALALAPPAAAQEGADARFFVVEVGDSTFTFEAGDARWVRPGLAGRTVDPARRDTTVARFRVLAVRGRLATALVTAQTTDVTPSHVALLPAPRTPWWRRRAFWAGLLAGGAMGAAVSAAAR
jgi:hypothetical protein